MKGLLINCKYNAITPLVEHKDKCIALFSQHDLLGKAINLKDLWLLPEAQKILKKQQVNGSWIYPGPKDEVRSKENYNQFETYRNLGILVERFSFNNTHVVIKKAAEYLFTFQTKEGDFRGIYGNQYTPNYTAAIAELLIKAGYVNDARIKKVFEWLIAMRQNDGGWAIPLRTRRANLKVISGNFETLKPDVTKPFSHMVTGIVLRAFAAHPVYRKSKEAKLAGQILLHNLFKKDNYPDRAGKDFWIKFTFPFWFTDLLSALDSLSKLGFTTDEPQITEALNWFVKQQNKSGMWELYVLKDHDKQLTQAWLSLPICRVFKRFKQL